MAGSELQKKATLGADALNGLASSKSQRSVADGQAALGRATTRLEERLFASLGKWQAASIRFEAVADVPKGGVLCALPALLALGQCRIGIQEWN